MGREWGKRTNRLLPPIYLFTFYIKREKADGAGGGKG